VKQAPKKAWHARDKERLERNWETRNEKRVSDLSLKWRTLQIVSYFNRWNGHRVPEIAMLIIA
jgi:hypothetical protein